MKKILIIHHGKGVGGALFALIGLINELKKQNEIVVLSLFASNANEYIKETGVKVISPKTKFYQKHYEIFVHSDAEYVNAINIIKKFKQLILYILSKYIYASKELNKIDFDFDLLYLNSTFISDWAYAARLLNKKVLIHIREPLPTCIFDLYRFIIRNTIKRNCNKVIAISYDNASRINILNKTTVIYDPVVRTNRNDIKPLIIDKKYKYFLYLGGSSRIKGFEQMANSLQYLNEDIKIFFLGDMRVYNFSGLKKYVRLLFDPFYRKQNRLISKIENSKNIIQIGLTNDVFSYYNNCLATISPFSKPHASLPILESFSCGTPVIVSDIKGMDELVSDKNGLFFENNNHISLAETINHLSKVSHEQIASMKSSSYKKYEEILMRHESISSEINLLII